MGYYVYAFLFIGHLYVKSVIRNVIKSNVTCIKYCHYKYSHYKCCCRVHIYTLII